jgi:hypothetical protein
VVVGEGVGSRSSDGSDAEISFECLFTLGGIDLGLEPPDLPGQGPFAPTHRGRHGRDRLGEPVDLVG